MGFTALNATDLETGKRITESLLTNIKNDLDYLYSNIIDVSESGGVIRNGGFEIDADVNGQPDNWDISLYTGGGSTLVTTATTWAAPIHGSKSLCFTRPSGVGNGAGYALSDYFPISTSTPIVADMILYSDTSAVDNGIGIYLYDKNKAYTTYISPYRSTNESTVARRVVIGVNPSTAFNTKFGRLMINCGGTAMGSSAHIYVDDVHGDVGLSGREFRCAVEWQPTYMLLDSGTYGENSKSISSAMKIELPYTNTRMVADLNCRFDFTIDRTTGATNAYSSVLLPQRIGIAVGNSTFISQFQYIYCKSTAFSADFNFLIPLDKLSYSKKSLDAHLRLQKDTITMNISKYNWPTTCLIYGPYDAHYKIISAGS